MSSNAAQNYLRTQVFTAAPEQLQMMLYDGAIRFAEQARPALEAKKWEVSYTMISKAQKIIAEMIGSLKHDKSPEMCGKLASIYAYIYRKLIEANAQHRIEALDEALRHLRFQRQTWAILMERLGREKAAQSGRKPELPAPGNRMESSLSLTG